MTVKYIANTVAAQQQTKIKNMFIIVVIISRLIILIRCTSIFSLHHGDFHLWYDYIGPM